MAVDYDFGRIVERRGTGALKWDALQERYGNPSLLPLWVADMDFETPDFIRSALKNALDNPVLGYTIEPSDYRPAIIDWICSHHGWDVKPEWISYIPGIVKGIGMAINVLVKPGEKVIIQPPVYHPFRLTTLGNKREVVNNPLREGPYGTFMMDFDNLAEIADDKCRLLILSNPHNPGGTVWDRDTLQRLASFCHERGITVISDEIHCDLALWGNKHIPFATVSPEAAEISITFGAPTKTFNIAGVVSSYAIVPNEQLRERYYGWMRANEFDEAPIFSPLATIAAFRKGEPWRQSLLRYIEGNIEYLERYLEQNIPQIKAIRPQASFLVWLDCRAIGLNHSQLIDLIEGRAGLALNDGAMFGDEGIGYMRINVGTPRSVLAQALHQLSAAIDTLTKTDGERQSLSQQ